MVNKVILVGRLGRDPETRYTGSGQAVSNFSIATDEQWKDRNSGEKREKTTWHKIVAWGKLAEIVQQYVTKGQLVYIEGKLSNSEWEDKDKIKRYKTEVVADTLRMLSKGNGSGGGSNRNESSAGTQQEPQSGAPEISDEDIPF